MMLRTIRAAKKNDRIDAGKIADRLPCDFLLEFPHRFHKDSGSMWHLALSTPAASEDRTDEEPNFRLALENWRDAYKQNSHQLKYLRELMTDNKRPARVFARSCD